MSKPEFQDNRWGGEGLWSLPVVLVIIGLSEMFAVVMNFAQKLSARFSVSGQNDGG